MTKSPDDIVFLLDVDNTLLDNDRVHRRSAQHLEREFGAARPGSLLGDLRGAAHRAGYADYLGALQRYRARRLNDPRLLLMSSFLVDYPFAERLYPGALAPLRIVRRWGPTVILSDGDVVFQPRKIQRSGLWDGGRGPRADLYPQGRDAGRRRAALSGPALRDGGRQAAHPGGHERGLGRTADAPCSRARAITRWTPQHRRLSAGRRRRSSASAIWLSYELAAFSGTATPCEREGDNHESHATAARSRPKPLARQHHRAACSTTARLRRYIDELSVTGLTSNPTIFDHAISDSRFLRRGDPRARPSRAKPAKRCSSSWRWRI